MSFRGLFSARRRSRRTIIANIGGTKNNASNVAPIMPPATEMARGGQKIPPQLKDKGIFKRRFEEINNFEKYLVNNGVVVLKFFLNVSKEEQKERFLERVDRPSRLS